MHLELIDFNSGISYGAASYEQLEKYRRAREGGLHYFTDSLAGYPRKVLVVERTANTPSTAKPDTVPSMSEPEFFH